MLKYAYIIYLLFVEVPIVLVGLAKFTGLTAIIVNAERDHIYELVRQRDDAISKGILPD